MKKLFFLLLVCFLISLTTAAATPIVGHQFYGYAGSGSTVSAVVNGVTFITSVASNKYYGYSPVFFVGAASEGITGGESGDTITFYIDGVQNTTYSFTVGGVTKLDFATDPGLTTTGIIDSDGDGVLDSADICIGYDDYIDTDSDGTPDGCDSTPTGSTDTDDDDDDDDSSSSHSSSSSGRTSTTTSTSEGCYHKWQCTSWGACEENGMQTRICYYLGNCTTEGNQSDTRQRCTYTAPEEEYVPVEEPIQATCFDSIQNQGERGIDCGGPCKACEIPAPPVEKEPKTNGLYIGLGIFIILIIIAVILGYKYKQKLLPYWEKLKSKFVKTAPAKTTVMPQQQYRQQYPQQQNYQYRR